MDKFFDSPIVQECIEDIMEMQFEAMMYTQYAEYANFTEQRENLNMLQRLLEKQKNMYYRCQLSGTESSLSLMDDIKSHFIQMGYNETKSVLEMFDETAETLVSLQKELDWNEKYHSQKFDSEDDPQEKWWHSDNCHLGLASYRACPIIRESQARQVPPFIQRIQRNLCHSKTSRSNPLSEP